LEGHIFDSDEEDELTGPSGTGLAAPGTSGRTGEAGSDEDGDGRGAGGARDPESVFKVEVGETFLRCLKLRFDQTNVVIELNSLKIAEDRTFADLARYLFTTLLALCLPAPSWCSSEYKSLFPTSAPDANTLQGNDQLLGNNPGCLHTQ
jgi:translation initiation factor eIF-2B subunit epsilon